MEDEEANVRDCLAEPELIIESPKSKSVLVFSKNYPEKQLNERWLMVVVKVLNKHGFILTSYRSSVSKRGNIIWKRK